MVTLIIILWIGIGYNSAISLEESIGGLGFYNQNEETNFFTRILMILGWPITMIAYIFMGLR
jgi:hypothetical protein